MNNLIIVAVLIIFCLLFIFVEPLIAKRKVKNRNEHGSARFSTKQEIKKNFKEENIHNIKESGFPILFSNDLKKIYFDRQTPHYVYLGSTGSGKSVTSVIPSCTFIANSKEKRSVFITDPKGEIFHKTSQMFKENNYKVLTIDFRNPECSNKINLLEPIINEYDRHIKYEDEYKTNGDTDYLNKSISSLAEANRLITTIATMIMIDKVEAKDPFWNNSAKNLLEGLISFFLEEYKLKKITKNQITLTSIRKFQNSLMDSKNFSLFNMYINKKEYGTKSKDSLTSILSASENTYKSITAVFGEKMNIFDDLNVANVTSVSEFDFNILGKEQVVIYLIVPDEDKIYFSLVTMIVGIMYKELVKLANSNDDKKLKIPVDFILDEFANCPPLNEISAMVSVARSRGIRFYFFIQSFSQLNDVYGKEVAQIILDNCGLVYLKTNTLDTAEEISKKLGKKTIESNSISHSMSYMNYNGNTSTNLIGRELLTPEEVMQLHYKTIIFPVIGYPIIRDTVLFNKFKIYKQGEVKRNKKVLSDLKNTFYTIENIFRKSTNNIDTDSDSFYKEQIKNEKLILKPVLDNLVKCFGKEKVKYKIILDNRVMVLFKQNRNLTKKEKDSAIANIDSESFHYELDKKEIRVYVKNILLSQNNEINLKQE